MASGSARTFLRLRWVLATLALLTLTGCLDLLEEIWLNPDGSARVVFDIGVPRSVVNLLKLKGQDPFSEIREKVKATEAELKKDPDVMKFEFQDFEKDGQHHLVYDLTVRDATRLNELQKQAMASAIEAQKDGPRKELGFNIERGGLGKYTFVQRIGEPRAATDTTEEEKPEDALGKELGRHMAKAMLGDTHFIVRVHGQAIQESNGTVNEQKDTVEWKYSLADLVEGEPKELRAVVQAGAPLWVWPVMLGVPLGVLWLAIAAARRKRAAWR